MDRERFLEWASGVLDAIWPGSDAETGAHAHSGAVEAARTIWLGSIDGVQGRLELMVDARPRLEEVRCWVATDAVAVQRTLSRASFIPALGDRWRRKPCSLAGVAFQERVTPKNPDRGFGIFWHQPQDDYSSAQGRTLLALGWLLHETRDWAATSGVGLRVR